MLFTVTIFCCTAGNWGCKGKKWGRNCTPCANIEPPLELTWKYSNSYQSTIQSHINRHKLYTQMATNWLSLVGYNHMYWILSCTIHTWICETKFLRLWNIHILQAAQVDILQECGHQLLTWHIITNIKWSFSHVCVTCDFVSQMTV